MRQALAAAIQRDMTGSSRLQIILCGAASLAIPLIVWQFIAPLALQTASAAGERIRFRIDSPGCQRRSA
jgi:hypothetical protein